MIHFIRPVDVSSISCERIMKEGSGMRTAHEYSNFPPDKAINRGPACITHAPGYLFVVVKNLSSSTSKVLLVKSSVLLNSTNSIMPRRRLSSRLRDKQQKKGVLDVNVIILNYSVQSSIVRNNTTMNV